MFSVNTNAGSLAALQNISASNKILEQTQARINTGLKVSSAKDNAAIFSIAQKLRGDVAGYSAVNQSLDRALSETDVAIAAAEATSDLLIQMKELAVAAKDSSITAESRTTINDQFTEIRDQIGSIIGTAEFNGRNIINGSDNITAIIDPSGDTTLNAASNDLTLETLNLDTSSLTSIAGTPLSSGTAVSMAGTEFNAGTDSEFNAALRNLEADNGGDLGGETLSAGDGTTTNVDGQSFDTDYVDGVFAALGVTDQYSSARLDGSALPFVIDFRSDSVVYLVRDGANSYLTVGDPEADTGTADTNEAATATLTNIESAITTVNDTLSDLGSIATRLELQKSFSNTLTDTLNVGIGNLVDADLARESANFQAIQTKQQLGLQALSIANQAPQSVLSLFR